MGESLQFEILVRALELFCIKGVCVKTFILSGETEVSLSHHVWSSVSGDLLGPGLIRNRVDVGAVILITIGIHFAVLAEEGSLVEGVLVGHVSCLRNLIQLSVEQVGRG